MSDKSNALRFSGDLWQRTFQEVSRRHPAIEAEHMYVDAMALMLVKNPSSFQVIVTNNMFGDIITDLGAALQGGLGMAASANVNPERTCMFEPVHGSAPKLAGKNVANPMGAILSVQMMLEHMGWSAEAEIVEKAVAGCVREYECTGDIGGEMGTREAGNAVCRRIQSLAQEGAEPI